MRAHVLGVVEQHRVADVHGDGLAQEPHHHRAAVVGSHQHVVVARLGEGLGAKPVAVVADRTSLGGSLGVVLPLGVGVRRSGRRDVDGPLHHRPVHQAVVGEISRDREGQGVVLV
ncbi:MAG: hypothetical protein ACRDPI_01815, partial [Nocardioidaceae bacterium]